MLMNCVLYNNDKGKHQKIPVFLGLCPKLWVDGNTMSCLYGIFDYSEAYLSCFGEEEKTGWVGSAV